MKNILQSWTSIKLEEKFNYLKEDILKLANNRPDLVCILLLAVACYIFLFIGIDFYPLIDVDETRYAIMARDIALSNDWTRLMLNGAPFLEKPPLYFWIEAYFIQTFQNFTPWVVRFPIALMSTFLVFFTYHVGKRIIDRKFGVLSALVLLTSLFFLILSHIAILDMVLTVFMTSALYSYFLTHFCEDKHKKYYWWFFYTFVGLGFLAKGILALAIPAVIVFAYALITKTVKDIFKPLHLFGFLIFLTIIMPWHIEMYEVYGYQFIKEYFLIHHFGRFMGSEYIGRERPFWYFIPVFLVGFLPWTIIFLSFVIDGCKKLHVKYKLAEGKVTDKLYAMLEATNNEQKIILFSSLSFAVMFLVFSLSSTKLPTYILPLIPFASILTGYLWWYCDKFEGKEKSIYNSTLIFSTIFIILTLVASMSFYFIPVDIQEKLISFKGPTIIGMYLLSIFLILRLSTRKTLSIFFSYVIIMFFLIMLSVCYIFNFIYSTGQKELVDFAIISSNNPKSVQLINFDFAVKPSVMINYHKKITFITDPDFKKLDKLLKNTTGPSFVIVKNKNFESDENYMNQLNKRLELLQMKDKYSLYVKDVNDEYNANNLQLLNIPFFGRNIEELKNTLKNKR